MTGSAGAGIHARPAISIYLAVKMPFRAVCLAQLRPAHKWTAQQIFGTAHEIKVIWTYAAPSPAQMIQLQVIGDGADAQLVGDPVSQPGISAEPAEAKVAVAITNLRPEPPPAVLGLINEQPEIKLSVCSTHPHRPP
jgi:hypothetical protein